MGEADLAVDVRKYDCLCDIKFAIMDFQYGLLKSLEQIVSRHSITNFKDYIRNVQRSHVNVEVWVGHLRFRQGIVGFSQRNIIDHRVIPSPKIISGVMLEYCCGWKDYWLNRS